MYDVDWQVGNGEGDGVRALIAFYPTEAANSNGIMLSCRETFTRQVTRLVSTLLIFLFLLAPVTLVITPLGADFTRLESFGKVDAFAETLVGFQILHLDIIKHSLKGENVA